jgi:hypothetical protein
LKHWVGRRKESAGKVQPISSDRDIITPVHHVSEGIAVVAVYVTSTT